MTEQRYAAILNGSEGDYCYDVIDLCTRAKVHEGIDFNYAEQTISRLNGSWNEARDLAERLGNFVNGCDSRKAGMLADALSRQHRTLQQAITGLMVHWFDHLAGLKENQYDMRMADSVGLAKALSVSEVWDKFKYLRHI